MIMSMMKLSIPQTRGCRTQANTFYDMSYVSKRAIGLRMREAERNGHVVQNGLGHTWQAVVGLSETASLGTEDEETDSGATARV